MEHQKENIMYHFLACIRYDHPTPSLLFGDIIAKLHRFRHDRKFAIDFPDYDLKKRFGQLGLTLAVHTETDFDSKYFREIIESNFEKTVNCTIGAILPEKYRIVKGLRPLKNREYSKELTIARLRAKGVEDIDETLIQKRNFYELPYILISSKGNKQMYPRFVYVENVKDSAMIKDCNDFSTLGFSLGGVLPFIQKQ